MKKILLISLITMCLTVLASAQELTYSTEIQRKADAGNAFAQSQLGWCYEYGAGVEKDLSSAYRWYRKAAEQGDAYSINAVAKCYWNGKGVAKDKYEALKWYEKAAHSNNEKESKQAREMLDKTELSENCFDYEIARLAEEGDDYAQFILGTNLSDSKFKNTTNHVYDLSRGLHMLSESEKHGNLKARHNLGFRYLFGPDEIKDLVRGAQYLKKNAESGYRKSMYSYGNCLFNRIGVEQNDAEGIYWITQAAKKGYPDAMAYLGIAYENGLNGLSKDYAKAVEWYRKGSDSGSATALLGLGSCYYYGHGVPKDFWKAENYFGQAANLGDQTALSNLEAMAPEILRKFPSFLKELKNKAAAGEGEAQCILGGFYLANELSLQKYGVYYNPEEAARLITESAKNGCRDSFYIAGLLYETGGLPQIKYNSKECCITLEDGIEDLVQPNFALAGEFYRKCIEAGKADRWYPMIRMARAYYNDSDKLAEKSDYPRCISLLNELIEELEQGDPCIELMEAYTLLSKCYRFGRGVAIDNDKADELLKKSIRMGDPSALTMRSTMTAPHQKQ